jgi:mono/diheme cytochrome c family protein
MTRALLGLTLTLALATVSVLVYATEDRAGASAGAGAAALDGASLFQAKGCVGCHQRGDLGQFQIGPDLTGLGERATEVYVRQSIRDPQAFLVEGYQGIDMPTLALTEAELDVLVVFLLEDDA